jgi:hypothetical protein
MLSNISKIDTKYFIFSAVTLIFSPQLFLLWGRDIGRIDMFVGGMLAWAALSCVSRRYVLAAILVGIGSLAHETAVIFGAPLFVGLWFLDYRNRDATVRQGVMALFVLAAILVTATVVEKLFGPTPRQIAQVMLEGKPESYGLDYTTYMTIAGARSLLASACMSFNRAAGWLYLVGIFAVLAAYIPILLVRSRMSLSIFAFVALLPMLALSIIAIDYGRWLSFAVLTGWLASVATRMKGMEPADLPPRSYVAPLAAFAVVFAMGPGAVFYGSEAVRYAARHIWPPSSENMTLDQCDPGWRSVITFPPTR